MHCASCDLIDKLLSKQPGVIAISTSYGAQKVALEFDETKITLEQIDGFVNKLGYDVCPDEESNQLKKKKRQKNVNFNWHGDV